MVVVVLLASTSYSVFNLALVQCSFSSFVVIIHILYCFYEIHTLPVIRFTTRNRLVGFWCFTQWIFKFWSSSYCSINALRSFCNVQQVVVPQQHYQHTTRVLVLLVLLVCALLSCDVSVISDLTHKLLPHSIGFQHDAKWCLFYSLSFVIIAPS